MDQSRALFSLNQTIAFKRRMWRAALNMLRTHLVLLPPSEAEPTSAIQIGYEPSLLRRR